MRGDMDCKPQSDYLLTTYRIAAGVSMSSCLGFCVFVFAKRLQRTVLVKQVLFLCLSDFLVLCWEALTCVSLVHFQECVGRQEGDAVDWLFPLLRTLQLSSVLWSTLIALGVAATVRGKRLQLSCRMHLVWPCAALLSSAHWIVGLQLMGDGWPPPRVPEDIFMVEVLLLLIIVLVAYMDALVRIHRLSTFAVLRRSLHRILHYVSIFFVFYVPYIVTQALASYEQRCQWNRDGQPIYVVVYLLYFLLGVANVSAYGWNHWDGGWRSERRVRSFSNTGDRPAYVVRILDDPEVAPVQLDGVAECEEQIAVAFQQNYGPSVAGSARTSRVSAMSLSLPWTGTVNRPM